MNWQNFVIRFGLFFNVVLALVLSSRIWELDETAINIGMFFIFVSLAFSIVLAKSFPLNISHPEENAKGSGE